jgi:hypothetical protein
MSIPLPQARIVQQLRQQLALADSGHLQRGEAFSTGCPALDRVLPRRGITRGSLLECLDDHTGSGAETLAVVLTRAVGRSHGLVVILDRQRQFYPLAMAAWGIALEHLVVIQPATEAEELWAATQALRSRAVSAVWLRRDRLTPFDFRRLRLAAEEGETLGILLRPIRVRGQPTWADVQWSVQPRSGPGGRRLQVELTRCRGGTSGMIVDMELDDVNGSMRDVNHHETLRLSSTTALADSTASGHSAGMA